MLGRVWQGVVTSMSLVEGFATSKILDQLIVFSSSSWSLDLQRTKWQLSLFVFIDPWFLQFRGHLDPWSALKILITWFPFNRGCKTFHRWHTSDYSLSSFLGFVLNLVWELSHETRSEAWCVIWCVLLQGVATGRQQVVTDLEREHVMSGNLDQLVEEQRRIDEEKDAEVRGEERGCGGRRGGGGMFYHTQTKHHLAAPFQGSACKW